MSLSDFALVVSMVKDSVLAVAAVVTAAIAVRGLRKWHQEMSGKADFDAARALARATFKLQNEMNACRSPLIRSTEFPAGYDHGAKTNTSHVKAMAIAHAYNSRWTRVVSALDEFETQSLEAEALWGAEIRPLTSAFRLCANTIGVAMEAIVDDAEAGGTHFESDKAFGRRMRAQASGSPDDDQNELSKQIKDAAEQIEKKLREKLARS